GAVLVADDEAGVRKLFESLLNHMGLEVIAAASGEQALELYREHAARIRFALLDFTMPGLSGVETLARLREIRPDLCAVLTSGHLRGTIAGYRDEVGFVGFLQKPFDTATFRQVIADVCARLALPRR